MESNSNCNNCGKPIPIFSMSQTLCYNCLTKNQNEKNS